jgi:CHASE3 domain sensor protein
MAKDKYINALQFSDELIIQNNDELQISVFHFNQMCKTYVFILIVVLYIHCLVVDSTLKFNPEYGGDNVSPKR